MTGPGDGDGDASSSTRRRRRRPEPSPTQRALGLLTRREHSRKELARKLVERGVESQEAEAAVERLVAAGWQDDARFAESLVRNRAASGYGPGWIRAELATHGLGSEAIATAMATFDGDWSELAVDLVHRRLGEQRPGDAAWRRKAGDLLLRRGFAMSDVRFASGAR